ncbi:hypothetical protein EKD04_020000 [Chloroflexales bacterium ZM16-3]|nr:hypothetical protein [Chloroflexales bacterium ZM16-3]
MTTLNTQLTKKAYHKPMPHAPDITILLAPAAAGKTIAALAGMAEPRRGRAILLVPSGLHRDKLAPQVRDRISRASLCQPSRLVSIILKEAAAELPQATPTLRARLLRAELRRLADEGAIPQLAPVAHKAGLVADTLALIDDLQAAQIAPESLGAASVGSYDTDLAAIYAAYQAALIRIGVEDEAGRMARAIDILQSASPPLADLALLIVDGFDQFTPLQMNLLRALCDRAERSLITLTGGPDARPAHRRFIATLAALRAALPEAQLKQLPRATSPLPPLAHAEASLFDLADHPPADAGGAIQLISAPDREREVRAALRHVRRLLREGTAPEDIAVIFRSAAPYAPLLREVAAEYSLPLAIVAGLPLAEAPPIVSLLSLLSLPSSGYPRRALVECWRDLGTHSPSLVGADLPNIPSFTIAASLLDRATRAGGYAGRLDRLRALLQRLADNPPPPDDDLDGPAITPAEATALLALLAAFVTWLTPPATATPAGYVEWTRQLLSWSDNPGSADDHSAEAGGDSRLPTPDSRLPTPDSRLPTPDSRLPFTPAQAERLRRVLSDLAESSRMLQEPPQSYSAFLSDLQATISAASYGQQSPEQGYVAALDALAARSACFPHVVLIGLAEGEFPARLPAPAFYTRRERETLAARGVPLPANAPADERTLFYEAVTRAQQSLALCYTRLDEGGNPLEPSPYLRDLLGRFIKGSIPKHRIQAGSAPDLAEAASPQERLIALMVAKPGQPPDPDDPLHAHVARACQIEREREGFGEYGPHEGILDSPQVIAQLSQRFGPAHQWSVTQINDYTICPFRFAASHILGLRQPGEPEEGMAQAGRGRLLHAILSSAGRRWAARDMPAAEAHEDAYLADLAAAAAEVLSTAPQTYGFEPGPLWEWEQADLRGTLARALRRSLRASDGWEQYTPTDTETSFGIGRGHQPLQIDTSAGPALIIGRIDRIDRAADGSLALIDYKSGSTPPNLGDTLNGRDVQLTVYTLAAEQILAPGQPVAQAGYLALGSGRRSKALTSANRTDAEQSLRTSLGKAITGARTGRFPVSPSGECPSFCAYANICRLNLAKRDALKKVREEGAQIIP